MPNFTGYVAASGAAIIPGEGNPALNTYAAPLYGAALAPSAVTTGVEAVRASSTAKIGWATMTAGNAPATFADLWYNQFHLIPMTASVGNVLSDQQVDCELWSAFPVERTLNADTIAAATGITQSVPGRYTTAGYGVVGGLAALPQTFKAGESRKYHYVISATGPAAIAASFAHGFLTVGAYAAASPTFTITGQRLLTLAFLPNWGSGISERLEWLGSVASSRSGKEQRRRLIQHPRRVFTYPLFPDTPQELSLFQSAVYGLQTRKMAVPIWRDAQWLGTTLAAGVLAIPVTTADRDFADGGMVMLFDDFQTFEIGTIAAGGVAAGQVTLTSVTEKAWNATTRIVPCRMGRIAQDQPFERLSSRVTTAPLTIEIDPGGVPAVQTGYTYPYTYRGESVFAEEHNWVDANPAAFARNSVVVDDRFGAISIKEYALFPTHSRPFTAFKASRADITEFLRFLGDRRGIDKPFWMPSGQADIEPTGTIGAADTAVIIKEIGYADYSYLNNARRDIVFVRATAGYPLTMRRVTDAVSNGNGTETLTLDSALGYNAAPADHAMVSWLNFCRLDSEAVSLLWHTTDMVTAKLQLRAIRSPD